MYQTRYNLAYLRKWNKSAIAANLLPQSNSQNYTSVQKHLHEEKELILKRIIFLASENIQGNKITTIYEKFCFIKIVTQKGMQVFELKNHHDKLDQGFIKMMQFFLSKAET
jgi:hypothetical protein